MTARASQVLKPARYAEQGHQKTGVIKKCMLLLLLTGVRYSQYQQALSRQRKRRFKAVKLSEGGINAIAWLVHM